MCTFPGYLIPFSLVNALHLSSFNYFHIYLFLLLFCSTFCWILAHWGNSTSALPLISTSSLTMVAACGGEKRVEVINTRKAVVQGKELPSSLFFSLLRRGSANAFLFPPIRTQNNRPFSVIFRVILTLPGLFPFPTCSISQQKKGKRGGRER